MKKKNSGKIDFTQLEISDLTKVKGMFAPGSQVIINYELLKQPIPGENYKLNYKNEFFDAHYMGKRNSGYLFSIKK